MKRSLLAVSALLSGILVLSGCGKSEADKKAEAELNDKIMKVHEDEMAMAGRLDELLTTIDAAIAEHDSLAKLFPKEMAGSSTADLVTAKDRLSAAKDGMESWMAAHEPYNPGIKHDLAMQQLARDSDLVTQVQSQMTNAIAGAKVALDAHARAVAALPSPTKGRSK